VHGDYRLDNVIVDSDGRIVAVLDWEICTLGDPLADLGLLTVYWAEEGDPIGEIVGSATRTPGFPSTTTLAERYAHGSGRDLSELSFYVAFGYWKLACILQGVHRRYVSGAGGGTPWTLGTSRRRSRRSPASPRPLWGADQEASPAGITHRHSQPGRSSRSLT
jgi:aminoglycoside phosphotransferase (APT) family kinase protein